MDLITRIYQDQRSVFSAKTIGLLTGITESKSLNRRLNYYVHTHKLLNPRKGIYTKPDYNKEELACAIFTPSYLSLDYVLQKTGIIFQYDSTITAVSYLSREISITGQSFRYRKIKSAVLTNPKGIIQKPGMNIAVPERAFLDSLYLDKDRYFDYLENLDKKRIR